MKNHWEWYQDNEVWMGIGLLCLISATQTFVNFKLGQLIYILPEHFKWNMVAAQAMAGIFVAVYDCGSIGLWHLVLNYHDQQSEPNKQWMLVVGTISSVLFFGIYTCGFILSWVAVNKLAESKITIWAIKMYLEEKNDDCE